MKRPIRLALFTDSLHPSGVGQVMYSLARRLNPQKYTLFLVCSCYSGVDSFVEKMRPYVADIARVAVREEDEQSLHVLEELVQQLRTWRLDLFHNHIGATWEGAWGTLAARCAGVPVVMATEHLPNVLTTPHELEHRRSINRLLDRVVTVSESVRQSLIGNRLVPPEKVVTIENGVEPRVGHAVRAAARRELDLPADLPVILFLGRLVEQKDPATLLRAVRLLHDSGEQTLTLFAGDGWLRGELEALAQRLQLADHVRFLGNRSDVERLFAAANVLALPSLFEGLPLAALEAMSVGLPVVGCDAPGVRDAVVHGVNGWLVPIGDAEGLAQGLRLAFAERTGRQWAQASQHCYARRFTAWRMAEEYDRYYETALASAAPERERLRSLLFRGPEADVYPASRKGRTPPSPSRSEASPISRSLGMVSERTTPRANPVGGEGHSPPHSKKEPGIAMPRSAGTGDPP